MSGRVEHRDRRRVPKAQICYLAEQAREKLPELRFCYLPDLNLDFPGKVRLRTLMALSTSTIIRWVSVCCRTGGRAY